MHGVTCDRAINGVDCPDLFQASEPGRYDAILMDLQMPIIGGLDAARAIRSLGTDYSSKIPIIALAANAYQSDVEACLSAGMTAHLPKPLDVPKLLQALSSSPK